MSSSSVGATSRASSARSGSSSTAAASSGPSSSLSATPTPVSTSVLASSMDASDVSALSSSLASLASILPSAGANSTTPATNSTPGQPIVRTQTPIFACVPATYNISQGTPPYGKVFLIQSGDINAAVLKDLPQEQDAGSFSWGVDIQPGTSVTFVVKDSRGETGYSVPIVVQSSNITTCLPPPPSHAGAIAGGTVAGVAVIALAVLGFLFFRRQQRRRRELEARLNDESQFETVEGNYGEVVKRSLSTRTQPPHRTVSRSTASPVAEQHELPPRSPVAEPFDFGPGPPSPSRSRPPQGGFGTYNLPGLDYTPVSLDRIVTRAETPELPGYEEVRRQRSVRRRGESPPPPID